MVRSSRSLRAVAGALILAAAFPLWPLGAQHAPAGAGPGGRSRQTPEARQTRESRQAKEGSAVATPLGEPSAAPMSINRLTMWANSNGVLAYSPLRQGPGVVYPRGSATIATREGLVWGGYVFDGGDDILRIGGQAVGTGTLPGRIVSPGVAENPVNADVRIFRIRRDWNTANLRADAADTYGIPDLLVSNGDMDRLREEYRRDWLEWPWDKGAPWYERNGVPGYQPRPDGIPDSTQDEPGLAGADQVIWFAVNDLDEEVSFSFYGTEPIGMEEQVTCWAYNRPDGVGDVVFQRYRLIYKGTADTPAEAFIDSMVISKWADPDIGNYSDDYVGYDAARQFAYAYNAEPADVEFNKIPAVPSVAGYALLQGPRVPRPGSVARWDGGEVEGYENLPASSFTYIDGDTRTGDSRSGFARGPIMWNVMRGYQGVLANPPACLIDPVTGDCTSFELTGDPQTFSGWIDGRITPKGDRRIVLSAGPFSMARGDTQEVVFALAGGVGADHRAGIAALRDNVGAARDLYLNSFRAPATIPLPTLRPLELDNKVILDWESDMAALQAVEGYDSRGFRFENYELYQLPSAIAPISEGVAMPAFDVLKPRFLHVTDDVLRGRPLVNGTKYWFALRSRAFNPDAEYYRQRIYSVPVVVEVTPHSPNPGVVYPYSPEDTVSDAWNIAGTNEAKVTVKYFDPTAPDGHLYKLAFHRFQQQLIDLTRRPWWDLTDSTTGDTLLKGITIDTAEIRVIERGFSIHVASPPYGIRGVFETVASGDSLRSPVFNVPNPGRNYMMVAAGSSYVDTILGGNPFDVDVELRFGDSSWALMLGPTAPSSRWVRVPYTAWQDGVVGADTFNRQLYTVITGSGSDSVWRPSVLLDREYEGQTLEEFYPLTIVVDSQKLGTGSIAGEYDDNIPYDPVEGPRVKGFLWINGSSYSVKNAIWRVYIVDLDTNGVPAPDGTVVRFERYKLVRSGDEKLFSPSSVRSDDRDAALRAIDSVNVFPNPYYGFNSREVDRFTHFVTFNHLSARAVIRIFNLAGELVRTVEKDDPSQFATWDLNNHNGLPVGGGVYLAHLELRDAAGADLGTKTLRLMIVPEKQTLQLR